MIENFLFYGILSILSIVLPDSLYYTSTVVVTAATCMEHDHTSISPFVQATSLCRSY